MKLNLIPVHVSKSGQARLFTVQAVIFALVGIGAAAGLIFVSRSQLARVKEEAAQLEPQAQAVVQRAREADTIIQQATGITRNTQLARAMIESNRQYTDLYRGVLEYVPTFFRVTSISATPLTEDTALVTLDGVISSYQEYADIMLALFRIPGALRVQRSGFTPDDLYVPGLSEIDPFGTPIRPGQAPAPGDPLLRLDQAIAQANAAPTGFLNVGNFGTDNPPNARGAMPGTQVIRVAVVVRADPNLPEGERFNTRLRVPDARATLAQGAGAPAPGGFGAPRGPGGALPPPGRGPGPQGGLDEED